MCGIVGYLSGDGQSASVNLIRTMTEALSHRGPDDDGVYVDRGLAFGHRRLSILDLTDAGHQPMMTADRRFVITYNGEIYNFHELRTELRAAGRSFVSKSDTEVLLQGYAHWGAGVVERLNGMFAFAIWDTLQRQLFLARDRYGVKPLYFAQIGRSFLFASEVKAFLNFPNFRAQMDPAGLVEYLAFQNFFTEQTLFNGVHMFPAGHHQTVDATGASLKRLPQQQYWDYNFREPAHRVSQAEYVEELDRLFVQAVRRQIVSDVEVGSFLSGGIDSGSISAVAASEIPNLKTFTVGFDLHSASGMELAFDERERAEFMSYHFKTEHYEMVLKAGDMERAMGPLVWHLEEPRVGQSYPNFYAAKLASKFCNVVLTGAGGDEMFAGYPWRYYRAVVNDDFDHYVDKYFAYWKRMLPQDAMSKLLAPISGVERGVNLRDIFVGVFDSHDEQLQSPQAYVNHSLYFEAKTFLHGLLTVEDKLSMAHGLESRVPFLDNDLVDFAMALPVDLKLGNLQDVVSLNENEPGPKTRRYFQKTRDGKLLLREAMRRHVPDEITRSEKQGFSAPDASWFKGESIDFVKKRLLSRDASLYEFLDRKMVHKLVDDHISGRENRRLLVWSLLCVEQWLETFVSSPSALVTSPIRH